jgi:hypothetical protein
MGFGRRLQNHPRLLARCYQAAHWLAIKLRPLHRPGAGWVERLIAPAEELGKRWVFDCRMCGQCILHSTGMTCPMTCPKNLRNGPCGGVRADGSCEVDASMRCVWVEAYERSLAMTTFAGELAVLQPPVDRRLEGSSAWINLISGADRVAPRGWDDRRKNPK